MFDGLLERFMCLQMGMGRALIGAVDCFTVTIWWLLMVMVFQSLQQIRHVRFLSAVNGLLSSRDVSKASMLASAWIDSPLAFVRWAMSHRGQSSCGDRTFVDFDCVMSG